MLRMFRVQEGGRKELHFQIGLPFKSSSVKVKLSIEEVLPVIRIL